MKRNMKCEHCGENEANFFYKSVVNGKKTEANLCSDCARKLGYMEDFPRMTVTTSLFDLFAPQTMLSPFFGGSIFDEMDAFFDCAFAPVRATARVAAPQREAQSEADGAPQESLGIDAEKTAQLRRERELNSLKCELSSCVERQDFERAIELRDRIREMEK